MPIFSRSSALMPAWEVMAGWVMSDSTPPRLGAE